MRLRHSHSNTHFISIRSGVEIIKTPLLTLEKKERSMGKEVRKGLGDKVGRMEEEESVG